MVFKIDFFFFNFNKEFNDCFLKMGTIQHSERMEYSNLCETIIYYISLEPICYLNLIYTFR